MSNRNQTMTVGELISALREYEASMPVYAEWEGVWAPFQKKHFKFDELDGNKILTIWVEDYI